SVPVQAAAPQARHHRTELPLYRKWPATIVVDSLTLLHLSQSPLGDEFNQSRFHFPAIQSNADNIQVRVTRKPHHLLLPLVNTILKLRKLAARARPHPPGFHVEGLDPTRGHGRKLVRKTGIDHHEKDIVCRIEDRELFDHILNIREKKIRND